MVNRTARGLDPVVLKDRRINRSEHWAEAVRASLSEVHITGSDEFYSAIPKVVCADVHIPYTPVNTKAELLAIRTRQSRIRLQKNRRSSARSESERSDIGFIERALAENILLFCQAPDLS